MSLATICLLLLASCEIDEIENPNGPSLEALESGATLADLRLLASGAESIIRLDYEFYIQTVSIVAREYYDLNGTDPRYTGELLGADGAILDNNGFLTTRTFAARYRAIRTLYLLMTAVENTSAPISAEESNSFIGYAKTLQAYQLLLVLNHQFSNGCRLDTEDPDNLGPFVSYEDGLAGVLALLDEANELLSRSPENFLFDLSSGFSSLATDPGAGVTTADFRLFNRALAARTSLYSGNKSRALTDLSNSFLDLNGSLNKGAYHAYGAGGNDILNPLFYVPNNDLYTVHPSWLNDAEENDTRVAAKTLPLDPEEVDLPVTLDDLEGDIQVALYGSNTEAAGIVRNEELILIYAEANIGSNNDEAVLAINVIRNSAGLEDYSGEVTDAALLAEILNQRRYSLYGEGHRWIDLRRTNNLDEVPTDRPGEIVHEEFPRPITEEG
ncbi:MAG: RagB/SusD family nutrient uptake outer membrane protein [Bacteroidota bacterium]